VNKYWWRISANATLVKAAVPIPPDAVTVTRRLDQVADRTGKPARSLPDGKQTKRVGTGETSPKLRTTSPQSGHCPPKTVPEHAGR
jgi:hypothetical protein